MRVAAPGDQGLIPARAQSEPRALAGLPRSHLALLSPQGCCAESGHSHESDGPEEAREVCKPV